MKFLTAMPVLLSLIVFWNLVFLLFGIEGVLTEWFDSDQAVYALPFVLNLHIASNDCYQGYIVLPLLLPAGLVPMVVCRSA